MGNPRTAKARPDPCLPISPEAQTRLHSIDQPRPVNALPPLLRNIVSSYGRFALTAATFVVLTPLIVRSIGTEAYGLWTLVLSVVGFFGVLDLGFGTAVVKFVGECRGLGDARRRNEILSTTLVVYCVLAHEAVVVLWIIGLRSVVLNLPMSLFRGALFGSERIHEVNLVQLFGVAVYAAGVLVVVVTGAGVIALAVANLVAMLVEHAAYIWLSYRLLPDFALSPRLVRLDRVREIGSFSMYSLVSLISGLVLLRMDPALISAFLPLAAVAVYGVALKVAEYGLVFTKQFVNVLTPYFARSAAEGGEAIGEVFERASRLALAFPAAAFVAAAVFGGSALGLWLGPEFAAGGRVLAVLAAATTVSAPQLVASTYLSMTGHIRFTAWAAALAVLVNAGVSVALVGPLGLLGVALGTLTAAVIVDVFVLVPRALRAVGIGGLRYLRSVLRVSAPMGVQATLSLAASALVPVDSLARLTIAVGAGAVGFVATAWFAMLDAEERSFARRIFTGFRARLSRPQIRRVEA
jgi:O-antigen/teichoic acid export membrane protein